MEIVVRPARRIDLGRFAELMAVFTGTPLSRRDAENRFRLIHRDPEQLLAVATVDRYVVGLVGFRIRHNIESVTNYGEISVIVADNAWRKKGVGAVLIKYAENVAKQRGCIGLWLVSGYGREKSAHKFYVRQGFAATGVRFVKPLIREGRAKVSKL